MKNVVKLLAASMVAVTATSAMAETGKWYMGMGAGLSRYHDWASKADARDLMYAFGSSVGVNSFNGSQHGDADDGAFSYKVFGGYTITENVAVEFAYIDMGIVEANSYAAGTFYDAVNNSVSGDLYANAKAEVNAFTLDANLNYPITSGIMLTARAGAYSADTKLRILAGGTISSEEYNYSKTEKNTGFHYGAGVNFEMSKAVGVRAEWECLHGIEANDGKSDVSLLSASLTYAF